MDDKALRIAGSPAPALPGAATASGAVPPAGQEPVLRSPLGERFVGTASDRQRDRAGVHIAEWSGMACVVVRGRSDDNAFLAGVSQCLGISLPTRPGTFVAIDGLVALWMSPDEWWLLMARRTREVTLERLRAGLRGCFMQLVDTSGSLACLRVAGAEHLTLLRHLTPYDVQAMAVGGCVSTVFPSSQVTLVRSDPDGFMLIFRRSFAHWIDLLIERCARPYGLARCTAAQLPADHFSSLLAQQSV